MATGMFGANVDELMGIAQSFGECAVTLESVAAETSSAVNGVLWFGADATLYKMDVSSVLVPAITHLGGVLEEHDGELARQAEDQTEASLPGSGEGCLQSLANNALSFLKGLFVDGILGDLKDTLGLIGMNFDDGFSWNLDNAKKAWGDMLNGLGGLIGRDPETGKFSWDTALDSWKNLGKGLVAWDMWSEDPARAAGQTLWNLGSMLIPGIGLTKATKLLGAGDDAADAVRRADVDASDARRVDGDAGDARHPDDASARDRDSADSQDRSDNDKPKTPNGGTPERLPDSVTMREDGTLSTKAGDFPPERQITNLDNDDLRAQMQQGATDKLTNRFEPNTMYQFKNGDIYTTNSHGQVELASITRTQSELDQLKKDDPSVFKRNDPDMSKYENARESDEAGHRNAHTQAPSKTPLNYAQQSPAANHGVDRAIGSDTADAHQALVERRHNSSMQANPDVPHTIEHITKYDYNGTPETNPNYGRPTEFKYGSSYTDVETGERVYIDHSDKRTPYLKPAEDGFVTIKP